MHVRLGPAAVVNGAGLQREADDPSDCYVECAERQSATIVPLGPGPVWVSPTIYDGAFKRFFMLVGREI